MTAEAAGSDGGRARMNEEIHSLSPIEEESESTLRFESATPFAITPGISGMMRFLYEGRREPPGRMTEGKGHVKLRKREARRQPETHELDILRLKKNDSTGNSSSEDERIERGRYRLRKVEGSYDCLRASAINKEAEASGDNDEAETGLHEKSLNTAVKQLKGRVSQVEREIVALRKRRECLTHEICETLLRDLLIWRDDHKKRIDSQIARWQMTERKRIHDEMENTRTLYGGIQRHLDTLLRRSASSRLDFRRQIDVWEKRLKRDVVSLHENSLMEFREQFGAWFEVQNAINSSNAREGRRGVHKPTNETDRIEATMSRDDTEFLRKIEYIIKFEVQQQRDDLARRMDRKIAELWSAFEDFKHNFHLDRNYRRHDYVAMNNDQEESIATEDPSDLACQEGAKADLNSSSEEKSAP